MNSYYIDKTSNTSADTQLAIGFASLLRMVLLDLKKPAKPIVVRDVGSAYEVTIPVAITNLDLQKLKPFTLVRQIVTPTQLKNQQKQGKKLDGFDYEGFQEEARTYYEKIRKLPAKYRTPEARLSPEFRQLPDIVPPVPELEHYKAIQQMKIAGSFNELAQRWQTLEELQGEHISILLTLFQQSGNDIPAAIESWQNLASEHKDKLKGKVSTTQLQIVNPTTGKGSNRTKSSGLSEGNPDNLWLLELLKFVGFMDAAAPFILQGSKDRKTYVLQPKVIEFSTLQGMMRAFRAVCWSSTAIKMDVMASLRFAYVFVRLREQSLQGEIEDEDEFQAEVDEEQLYSIAEGFEVAFYKDMGSAYATMNISSINLPQWIPHISAVSEARDAQALLQEHLIIIQQLRNSKGEEGSEEYELLRFYRNFVSGRDLRPFWQFTTAYSGYLMSQREHEKDPHRYIRQFTQKGLEKLLTMSTQGQKLTPIISNPGFKRIAYAIRQSTVWAQYSRSQLKDRTYEVRYGLGQELMREARYKMKFIAALSTFLHQYNAETVREEEKAANRVGGDLAKLPPADRSKLRKTVSPADIDQIIELIDTYDSETVCSLLVAYGYASYPRKEKGEPDAVIPNTSGDDEETNQPEG